MFVEHSRNQKALRDELRVDFDSLVTRENGAGSIGFEMPRVPG